MSDAIKEKTKRFKACTKELKHGKQLTPEEKEKRKKEMDELFAIAEANEKKRKEELAKKLARIKAARAAQNS